MTKKIYYTADQCQTGGHECRHHHRSYAAAEMCRVKGYGQLAQVHKYIDGHEVGCEDEAQEYFDNQCKD